MAARRLHVHAFAFFGGVPRRISYDNSRIAISKITGPRERDLATGFVQLVSHYLFRFHFCLVRRPNEKGVVEGVVKFARQNFLVPVPQVRDLEELNAYLLDRCRGDLQRRVRRQTQTKDKLLLEEQMSFLPLPYTPFEACQKASGKVHSELLVRFDDNDYSAPIEYAYYDVTVKGYCDQVRICRFNEVIAIHPRCWGKQQQIFNPPPRPGSTDDHADHGQSPGLPSLPTDAACDGSSARSTPTAGPLPPEFVPSVTPPTSLSIHPVLVDSSLSDPGASALRVQFTPTTKRMVIPLHADISTDLRPDISISI